MQQVDYIVFLIYLLGVLAVGLVLAARNTSSSEMFAAGGQSPWWVSGLSGFMTMFSAGTFVVWGGIAYKHGMVAVAINVCYGLAAILVGWTIAGRWKQSGINTPAEFVTLRFGKQALQFYVWAVMSFKIIGTAVALYSLCVLMVAMMPMKDGSLLRDPSTGNFSLNIAILVAGGMVVAYTMIGGLWGVLMTDVVQFIVLNLAVMFVVPLALAEVGGVTAFVSNAPDGFMTATGGGYNWIFLAGWVAIHYFVIGAEWAFVQRYLCVPTPVDARKGAYLFGLLYLVSPFLWFLPPLIQRVRSPAPVGASDEVVAALAESAYIDICEAVLPAGMIGMMLAAMFSATASMVSSQLNVFAGVLTNDIFKPWIHNQTDERLLVWAGRGFTALLGCAIVGIALAVPTMGGAEKVIVPATSLMVGPLLAPLLFGLVSKRLPAFTVWVTAAICTGLIIVVKVLLPQNVLGISTLDAVGTWTQLNSQTTDILLGTIVPVCLVLGCLALSKQVSPGWNRLAALRSTIAPSAQVAASRVPAIIVAWSLVGCGAMMAALAIFPDDGRALLISFAILLWTLAGLIFFVAGARDPQPRASE